VPSATSQAQPGVDDVPQDLGVKKSRKSKPKRGSKQDAVLALPLPPPEPDLVLPFAEIECNCDVDVVMPDGEAEPSMKQWLKRGRLALRVGRCGRVLLDQVEEQQDADSVKEEDDTSSNHDEQTTALQQRLQKLLLLV
jgi:hypothetical protein